MDSPPAPRTRGWRGALPSRRQLLAAALVAACIASSLGHLRAGLASPQIDFSAYYLAACLQRDGLDVYQPPGPEGRARLLAAARRYGITTAPTAYLYPPVFLVAMRPFTLLPYAAAESLWAVVNWALLLGVMALGLALLRAGGVPSPSSMLLYGAFFVFNDSLRQIFVLGQVNLLIALLLMASLWLCTRGRSQLAAAPIVLAGLFKVTPGFLLAPFLVLAPRAFAKAAAGGLAVMVLFVLVLAPKASIDFVATTREVVESTGFIENLSLSGTLLRAVAQHQLRSGELDRKSFNAIVKRGDTSAQFFEAASTRRGLAAIQAALLTGALAVLAWLHLRRDRFTLESSLAIFACVMLLASPILWQHHLFALVLPLVVLLRCGPRGHAGSLLIVVLCSGLLPGLFGGMDARLWMSMVIWPLLLVTAAVTIASVRGRTDDPTGSGLAVA